MRKYFLFFSLLSILILAGAGCAANKQQTDTAKTNNQNGGRGNNFENFASSTLFANRVKASFDDLTEGKKIMVLGASNQDGTVNATQILIGDFTEFASGTGRMMASGTWQNNPTRNLNNQQNNNQGVMRQRPNGGEGFAGANGQNGNNIRRSNRTMSQGRVVGEILKKDANSLVVKLGNGGSRIVFYSDKTEVYVVEPPKGPPPGVSTSTSK